jgi:hypothetical protein
VLEEIIHPLEDAWRGREDHALADSVGALGYKAE